MRYLLSQMKALLRVGSNSISSSSISSRDSDCESLIHRYDLSLDEMRALTVQRVKFTMGLPLLKQAI